MGKVHTLLIHTTILESMMLKPNLMPGTTTPTLMPHTHNSTTDSTTESTTVFMEPVMEYTILTQPTSMELESMVPTHTPSTPKLLPQNGMEPHTRYKNV